MTGQDAIRDESTMMTCPRRKRFLAGQAKTRPPRPSLLACCTALVLLTAGAASSDASWIFRPSYFSHDPQSGQRVAQYAPGVAPYALGDANYRQSGYRHYRSSIRGADGSADRLHMVETWGAGEYIRPYGEWLRPYRAGATPYGPWGNPYGPWTRPFDSWINPYGLGRLWPSPYLPGMGPPGRPGGPGPGWPGPRPAPSPGRPAGSPDGDGESP